MPWQKHLCSVRFELLDGEGDDRERLRQAAREFHLAYSLRAEWSPDIRRRAEKLHSKLFLKSGTVAVRLMNEDTLREVSENLWRLSEIAEPCPWESAAAHVQGIEYLREARAALHEPQGDLRDRLSAATHCLRAAVMHVECWPEALRSAAEALTTKLSRLGSNKPDESVRRMGNRTAGEISQDILRLCDDADRHQQQDMQEQTGEERKPLG